MQVPFLYFRMKARSRYLKVNCFRKYLNCTQVCENFTQCASRIGISVLSIRPFSDLPVRQRLDISMLGTNTTL